MESSCNRHEGTGRSKGKKVWSQKEVPEVTVKKVTELRDDQVQMCYFPQAQDDHRRQPQSLLAPAGCRNVSTGAAGTLQATGEAEG